MWAGLSDVVRSAHEARAKVMDADIENAKAQLTKESIANTTGVFGRRRAAIVEETIICPGVG